MTFDQENLRDGQLTLKKRNRLPFSIIYELAVQPRKKDPWSFSISGEAKANHGLKPEIESGRLAEGGDSLDSDFILTLSCQLFCRRLYVLKRAYLGRERNWPLHGDAVSLELIKHANTHVQLREKIYFFSRQYISSIHDWYTILRPSYTARSSLSSLNALFPESVVGPLIDSIYWHILCIRLRQGWPPHHCWT